MVIDRCKTVTAIKPFVTKEKPFRTVTMTATK